MPIKCTVCGRFIGKYEARVTVSISSWDKLEIDSEDFYHERCFEKEAKDDQR